MSIQKIHTHYNCEHLPKTFKTKQLLIFIIIFQINLYANPFIEFNKR